MKDLVQRVEFKPDPMEVKKFEEDQRNEDTQKKEMRLDFEII